MIIKFTEAEFNSAKSKDLLTLQCERCGINFQALKRRIVKALNPKSSDKCKYCSKTCIFVKSAKSVTCKQCNSNFKKDLAHIRQSPNHFCSRSCAASYNNTHKSYGTRRSKLEIYIESQLKVLYPSLIIDYNKKSAINSELDIYISSLNLAFELNGILHYEPIYGNEKLSKIQSNDISKLESCHNAKIDLHVINTSQHHYVNDTTNKKYLDVIVSIINTKL